MSIDNTTWHARIGMFCILKPLLKSKSNTSKFSAYFTLIFILDKIFFYFNSDFSFFNCIAIKKQHPIYVFQNKVEKVQYRACLAITGAIQGTSREKIYDEFFFFFLIGIHFMQG